VGRGETQTKGVIGLGYLPVSENHQRRVGVGESRGLRKGSTDCLGGRIGTTFYWVRHFQELAKIENGCETKDEISSKGSSTHRSICSRCGCRSLQQTKKGEREDHQKSGTTLRRSEGAKSQQSSCVRRGKNRKGCTGKRESEMAGEIRRDK